MNTIREALDEITPAPEGDATATTLTPPPLVPAARGAATVLVLDLRDGSRQIVGRADADIVIAERSVSRRHAQLFPSQENLQISDLGSSNGTRRNGQDVEDQPVALSSGDVLEFGDVRLLLLGVDDYWVRLPELGD